MSNDNERISSYGHCPERDAKVMGRLDLSRAQAHSLLSFQPLSISVYSPPSFADPCLRLLQALGVRHLSLPLSTSAPRGAGGCEGEEKAREGGEATGEIGPTHH
eukprot:TRINITY_DN5333_c0_g1_i2.p2 TRINITY_DN5333_c0_g1~~TRINITY_DN5333_c0_g1_i2.p2  ORF type:complete len:104 (+),score=5.86 TRINITY_DN5333_c0_g1_i2:3-314(+)